MKGPRMLLLGSLLAGIGVCSGLDSEEKEEKRSESAQVAPTSIDTIDTGDTSDTGLATEEIKSGILESRTAVEETLETKKTTQAEAEEAFWNVATQLEDLLNEAGQPFILIGVGKEDYATLQMQNGDSLYIISYPAVEDVGTGGQLYQVLVCEFIPNAEGDGLEKRSEDKFSAQTIPQLADEILGYMVE